MARLERNDDILYPERYEKLADADVLRGNYCLADEARKTPATMKNASLLETDVIASRLTRVSRGLQLCNLFRIN